MSSRLYTFTGGAAGPWKVRGQRTCLGAPLPPVDFVEVLAGEAPAPAGGWALQGVTSNERYVVRAEKQDLVARQQGLGRAEATRAALIPLRKNEAWWALTQDERRAVFEEQSHHIRIGMKHLPPIARRLHHCRDLAGPQPFDFITWFEYAPAHEADFDALLAELRATVEWTFVDREVELRLERASARDGTTA